MSEPTESSPGNTSEGSPAQPAEDTSPTPQEDSEPSRGQRIMAILHRAFTTATYPIMVILTMVSMLLIVTFCVFPTLLCMTFAVCLYYCALEDPLPLSVLLRYMLSPDPNDGGVYPTSYPLSQSRTVIQSKLIARKLLSIDQIMEGQKADSDYPRKHPFPIKVSTENQCLHFSEPVLEEEPQEEDNNGEEEAEVEIPPSQSIRSNSLREDGGGEVSSLVDVEEAIVAGPEETAQTQEEGDIEMVECALEESTAADVAANHATPDKDGADGGSCTSVTEVSNKEAKEQEGETDNLPFRVEAVEDDFFGIGDEHERGTACDICLLKYEVGDIVAWSPNTDCIHCFHKECIMDWLVRKPTCPNCRVDYLIDAQDDNV